MDENRIVLRRGNVFVTYNDLDTFIVDLQRKLEHKNIPEKNIDRLDELRENPKLLISILRSVMGDLKLSTSNRLIRDNYFICSWPVKLVNYFIDTYFNYNPDNVTKLKKFDSIMDGYMSVANNVIKIWNNSLGFTKKEYEGRDEFYNEYKDIFDNFYEFFLSINIDEKNSKSNEKFAANVKRRLEKSIENKSLTYNELIIIFMQITAAIDYANVGDQPHFLVDVFSDEIDDYIAGIGMTNISLAPFSSPRGAFGMNTFLYLFFNGLGPISISINPIPVHKKDLNELGEYNTPFRVLSHDISHLTFQYSFSSGYSIDNTKLTCLEYFINKCTYQYILAHQEEIGVEKCKGMLYMMFIDIHEKGFEYSIYDEDFGDHWLVFARQRHYTPERYDIVLPKVINSGNKIVVGYMKKAFAEMRGDLNKIKDIIVDDINKNGPIFSRT
jgi:hypothetical protein